MFVDVNFYGIHGPNVCDGDYSQLQKHFKSFVISERPDVIPFEYEFFNKIYIVELKNNMVRSDIKKFLWLYSDPDHITTPQNVIFINEFLYKHRDINNFWMVITYGLYDLLKSSNHSKNSIGEPWSKFLTEGCYDPRLLIYIEQFCN